ncbi:MAG: utilization substance protein [Candidatus Parcubacteria bacterium]|jgi:N utilization substance protein A
MLQLIDMTIVKSEFALALNQVATERGISADDVVTSIEAAILAAFKKEYPERFEDEVDVKINKGNGETKIMKDGVDITPPGFGRIAAQTARQVILQKIREAEKKTVISHYQELIGNVIKGRIIRYDGYNAYVDIGKTEAILPKEEQIKNEKYMVNDQIILFLKEISTDKFGHSKILLSRTDPQLIAELFKREVPEITSGTVEIKKIVREPGERAKIAVFSSQGGVDPVGACVGQKGVRVETVTDELGGQEKIDIIQWNKDPSIFLMAALSPAKILSVELDETRRKARVLVDESQAPLAIGKSGINVNLASRLTDYEIDINQISTPGASPAAPAVVEEKTEVPATVEAETQPEETKTEEVKAEEPAQEEPKPKKKRSKKAKAEESAPTEAQPEEAKAE